MRLPQDVIRQKRDGHILSPDEIAGFIHGVTSGAVSEGQIAAFAMATFFKGMVPNETAALTIAMRDSGDILSWPDIDRPIVDKHSTGGVGDNVSLILAPLMAACGLAVPMISGRGLGHTGGTLDKLESIPGYRIEVEQAKLHRIIKDIGCAIVGPTGNLAPADKRIYAVRDVTATVDSLPMITASILAKKLAAGLQTLVLDVKFGSGAFMRTVAEAKALAQSLVDVANAAGVKTSALITDMNEPLANAAGNTLEIRHCLSVLRAEKMHSRLWQATRLLGIEMLLASKLSNDAEEAGDAIDSALFSGRTLEHFARMVAALGGPVDFVENEVRYLATAPYHAPVIAASSGWMSDCNAYELGMSVVRLGGGRTKPTDQIERSVGLSDILPLCTKIDAGQEIAMVHGTSLEACQHEANLLANMWTISDVPPAKRNLVLRSVS